MNNNFYPAAVDKITQAITADHAGDYEKAYPLYKAAIEYFMTGMKYDSNPASKAQIKDKVTGYMDRAEALRNVLESQKQPPSSKGAGGGAVTRNKDEDSKEDDDKSKMRGALSSAIVSEKPNVKW